MAVSSSILISAPPKETPFLAANGRVSDPWLAWLQSVTKAGVVVQQIQQQQIIAEDNSTDGNNGTVATDLLDAIALTSEPARPRHEADTYDFTPAARPVDPVVDTADSVRTWRAEIDELRMLIDAFPLSTPGGAYGSFTSADGHTVTVVNGLITSIV